MKNKTPIIIVMLFLLTACSGTSSFSDSSDIDFNQDVAVIAQGIDRFERNSQNATDMAGTHTPILLLKIKLPLMRLTLPLMFF